MANRRIVPNFFVAGAPKCGTTSLYAHLRAHPNIFMCSPKEPAYFYEDLTRIHAFFGSFDDYLALFRKSGDQHLAVGEASTAYFYSRTAMKRIHDFNADAKIIVMVRNPIDFVRSLHAQLLFNFNEDREDFVEAWSLQEERARGRSIPERCRRPRMLQYRAAAKFGEQLERLLTIFPRNQVMCILFDDFIADPRAVYLVVLAFLGVPDDGRTEFPRYNAAKTHRWESVNAFMKRPPRLVRAFWSALKRVGGPKISRFTVSLISRFLMSLVRANAQTINRMVLPESFRDQLIDEFRPDIAKLSRLIGRDLSRWTGDDRNHA